MPVTQLVLGIVESLLEMASNLFLVSLFTIYLLLGRPSEAAERTQVDQQVLEVKCMMHDTYTHTYIHTVKEVAQRVWRPTQRASRGLDP